MQRLSWLLQYHPLTTIMSKLYQLWNMQAVPNTSQTSQSSTEIPKMPYCWNIKLKSSDYAHNWNKSKLILKLKNWMYWSNRTKKSQKNIRNKKFNSCPKSIIYKSNLYLHLHKLQNLLSRKEKNGNRNWLLWNKITKI